MDIQVEMLVGPDRYLSRSPQQGDDTEFMILNYHTMKWVRRGKTQKSENWITTLFGG